VLFVNGKRRVARRAHNLRSLTLKNVPDGSFTVKIVSRTSLRIVRRSTHQFSGRSCGEATVVTDLDRSRVLRPATRKTRSK
jgi:hypothetical protein